MDSTSSPSLPLTFDPPLREDWDQSTDFPAILPSSTYSDELEALLQVQEEAIAEKTKEGQVIQHRAWTVGEVFRSDIDHLHETPLRPRSTQTSTIIPPSSSPSANMPAFISSPVAYPPSSSPPVTKTTAPSVSKPKSRTFGGFLDDDSDDENTATKGQPIAKRRKHGESDSVANSAGQVIEIPKEKPAKPQTIGGFLVDEDEDETQIHRPKNNPMHPSDALPTTLPPRTSFLFSGFADRKEIKTCSGKTTNIRPRQKTKQATFEELVAARSTTKEGRAKKSHYGIDIQNLVDEAAKNTSKGGTHKSADPHAAIPSIEQPQFGRPRRTLMWTEKYRARRFFDLVGDDRTHREVLGWLKGWDPVVFPQSAKTKHPSNKKQGKDDDAEETTHRKILLLTGPPGLGKTTLAHVCAAQAGYEVMEINASDERSSNVVKGRIRTTVGTESVKTIGTTTSKTGEVHKSGRPICVVVDEVDGVVSGSGGSGEGGFVKALIDLIQLDAKNSAGPKMSNQPRRKKKGDDFRLLRPLILICNDVYHPSLRPLRQSSLAEVIHIRKPPLEAVVNRTKSIFEREGVACDLDGVRKLCEAVWGINSGPESRSDSGTAEGDIRSVLVVGEWVAGRLRASGAAKPRLTRKWVEQNVLENLSHGGQGTRGVGRGGAKEVVSRVFLLGAGFSKPTSLPFESLVNKNKNSKDDTVPRTTLHASDITKKAGMERLREMVDTSGDVDRIVTEIFSVYPSQPFNDDTILSKPDAAYEWLHFHDACSSRVYSEQEWELMPYLSQPVLACHHLFAAPKRHYNHTFDQKKRNDEGSEDVGQDGKVIPFSGPRADYDAKEAEKLHRATITEMQSSLNPTLLRSFRSPEEIATNLLPYVVRMLTPEVKPVVVGGSGDSKGIASVRKEREKYMVNRAVHVMAEVGVKFERGRLEGDFGNRGTQWVYRMEPPLDGLVHYPTHTSSTSTTIAPVRYAVRQVLDQEYQKYIIVRENEARQLRYRAGNPDDPDDEGSNSRPTSRSGTSNIRNSKDGEDTADRPVKVKRDFFGRILKETDGNKGARNNDMSKGHKREKLKVWVTFHEGFSNAVRKPITVEDLLRSL